MDCLKCPFGLTGVISTISGRAIQVHKLIIFMSMKSYGEHYIFSVDIEQSIQHMAALIQEKHQKTQQARRKGIYRRFSRETSYISNFWEFENYL